MSNHLEDDDLLKRLHAEDPSADAAEPDGERQTVRARAKGMLGSSGSARAHWRITPPRIAVAAGLLIVALGVALALTLGGSSPGPARALAIEKTPKWVTLRLTDPSASQDEMNQELADAGIDRVRVMTVPGPPDAVGTWPGYVEFGPHCQGGVTRFGYDVDIPISRPFNKAGKHGAEQLFDLTLERRTGVLISEEVGDPYSKSTVRIPTDAIDNPRNAAKVLVAARPRSPDDSPAANDIGPDQLVALGGTLAQYGEAAKSGDPKCSDFGLKPYPKPTFPPSKGDWVVIHVTASQGGARKMTRELRSGGINGKVRQIPAIPQETDRYMGFSRVPALPKQYNRLGNSPADITGNPVPHVKGPAANDIALRRDAFDALPNARWTIYVGRPPQAGETPKVVGPAGPEDARKALKHGCRGLVHELSPVGTSGRAGGTRSCGSMLANKLPPAPNGR